MQFRKIYWGIAGILALFIAGCTGSSDVTKVVIVSTNDIHARIENFPKFATFLKQQRAASPHMIIVDGGDRFSGNVYVDNAEERGKPIVMLMNKMGYDGATFGNHDFDYGQEVLKKRLEEMEFPVVCANIQAADSRLGQPEGYFTVEKAGFRFCFVGMIEIDGRNHIPATNPANLADITFCPFSEIVEENEKLGGECDVLIGLTHLGYTTDSLLAMKMPELDVIIGGHSHTLIREPKLINNVLVTQTGSHLNYAGVTTLEFRGRKLMNKTFHVVKLDTVGVPDAETAQLVKDIRNRPEFLEKIGITSRGMKYKEDVASLVTDAMCEAADCDFAFYNKGGIRINSIPEGDITKETVYRIEPFSNYVVTHYLSLNEIKELILNRFNGIKNPDKRYIDLFMSEGRYTILKDKKGTGVDVVFVDKNGRKLKDEHKTYKVGLSNYVNSTYEFTGKGKGNNTGIYIVKAVMDYVKAKHDVNYNQRRTFVQPLS